jgi:hypothetical protein
LSDSNYDNRFLAEKDKQPVQENAQIGYKISKKKKIRF